MAEKKCATGQKGNKIEETSIYYAQRWCDMFSQIERQTEGHRKVADKRTKKRT